VRSWVGVTITTTSLVLIASTIEIAVCIQIHRKRKGGSTPALLHVLGTCEAISQRCALGDTHVIGQGFAGNRVGRQLSSRVILFETTDVPILCSAICKQGTHLLSDSITVELDDLLAHVRVSSVDGPSCIAVVAGNVDL